MFFTKVQGLGNDFVLVEAFAGWPVENPAELAEVICDRYFGVGADGLVFLSWSDTADLRMRIWNADGSEAEMCGNAIRCVGKYAFEHGLVQRKQLTVETLAGVRQISLQLQDELVTAVTVDMGCPILDPEQIPVNSQRRPVVLLPIHGQDQTYRVTAVSMGNPHAVVFVPDLEAIDLKRQGSFLERHECFPRGTNVEFVQVVDPELVKVLVWERGVGATLACGTGACAVAVACVLNGLSESALTVELPGGRLEINWRNQQHVLMTGPAELVYTGEWPV